MRNDLLLFLIKGSVVDLEFSDFFLDLLFLHNESFGIDFLFFNCVSECFVAFLNRNMCGSGA